MFFLFVYPIPLNSLHENVQPRITRETRKAKLNHGMGYISSSIEKYRGQKCTEGQDGKTKML